MKADKKAQLLRILAESTSGVSTVELARLLDVSERSVRNYIKELNNEDQAQILSTRDGYRLKGTAPAPQVSQGETQTRFYRVLSDLLSNREGFDVFDEAETLHVSDSTVTNTILPKIKELVRKYDLTVESQKFRYVLKGSEQNKRKLIGHIVTSNSYGFFNSKDALEQLFPNQNIDDVMQKLYIVCQGSSLFLNDFALNNLLVHLLVIFIRLESNDSLDVPAESSDVGFEEFHSLLADSPNRDEILDLADRIVQTYDREYGLHIPPKDYQQILILIILSVEHKIVGVQNVIQPEFVDEVAELLAEASNRYCTPAFSSEFVMQFSLHLFYAKQRCAYHISYPNPIGPQFKHDYAPIYDMAVWLAHRFGKRSGIEFSEDEIAFLAFHIGAYLENANQSSQYLSCIVVTEGYRAFSESLVKQLRQNFSDQLVVRDVLPLNRYLQTLPECDLLITTVPLPEKKPRTLLVNPILTKANLISIRGLLEELHTEQEACAAREFLHSLLHEELYFRNINCGSAEQTICFLGDACVRCGYAQPAFVQDVLLRESVSCTAFTDTLAVPHAMTQYADRSFICVLHNDTPLPWNDKTVRFVLLIGITEQDMKYFKGAFDLIVELFSSVDRTLALLKTDTFAEFCEKLN